MTIEQSAGLVPQRGRPLALKGNFRYHPDQFGGQHRIEEFILFAEVLVDAFLVNPGGSGNPVDPGASKASLAEFGRGRLQQLAVYSVVPRLFKGYGMLRRRRTSR